MRRPAAIFLLLPTLLVAPARLEAQTPAADKGVINWNLDRLDSIGGHKVTVVGQPRVIETPEGKALQFDGVDDAIFLEVNPLAGLKEFTVEVIFRPDAGGPKEQRFFHLQEAGSENRVLFETRLTDDGKWFLDTFLKSGEGNYTQFAKDHLHPLGPWYHAGADDRRQADAALRQRQGRIGDRDRLQAADRGQTSLGVRINKVHWYQGAIRQVRITPRVLPPEAFLKP